MRIEVTDSSAPHYPCLKKTADGLIVFFTKPRCGIVLQSGLASSKTHPVGYYDASWCEGDYFELFVGTISLSN